MSAKIYAVPVLVVVLVFYMLINGFWFLALLFALPLLLTFVLWIGLVRYYRRRAYEESQPQA